MAIDVLDYAILGNHLHVVLRNRPDLVSTWSDEEVARRWWLVCPSRRNEDGTIPDPKPCELGLLLRQVDQYRARLSDISWFMRLACQPIARWANQEDPEAVGDAASSACCNPIRSPRVSNEGFLPLTRDQYLSLLDVLGRVVRPGKRGSIPPELPPILERLRIEPCRWFASLLELFEREADPLAERPASSFG
jgi:hypothetical protein